MMYQESIIIVKGSKTLLKFHFSMNRVLIHIKV